MLWRAEEMGSPCPSCLIIHSNRPWKILLSTIPEPVRRRFANVLYSLCLCQGPESLLWESLSSRELSFTTNHQKGPAAPVDPQLSPGTRDGQTDKQPDQPSPYPAALPARFEENPKITVGSAAAELQEGGCGSVPSFFQPVKSCLPGRALLS